MRSRADRRLWDKMLLAVQRISKNAIESEDDEAWEYVAHLVKIAKNYKRAKDREFARKVEKAVDERFKSWGNRV